MVGAGLLVLLAGVFSITNKGNGEIKTEIQIVSENIGTEVEIEEVKKGDEESLVVVKQKTSLSTNMVSTNSVSENNEEIERVNCELLQFPQLSDEDIYYLKKVATCEAGDVDVHTISLVMLVILNRVKSSKFPDTIYEVITQDNQFNVVKSKKWKTTEPNEKSDEAFNMIWDTLYDYSEGALYFESCKDADNWHSRNLEYLYKSDGVRFYK